MTERYPWEEYLAEQMEFEPTTAGDATAPETAPAPPPVEPAVQPDGDPRRPGETTPPGERELDTAVPGRPTTPPTRPQGDPLRPVTRERPVARKEYYSIGEVSELAGLPAHVLRYWETQFPVLNPSKNRSGNRAYQRKEIKLILLVKHLLYEEKYTVEGAKAKLEQLRKGGQLGEHSARALDTQSVALLRTDLAQLRELLAQ
jgi:DNA-binding transcriptional MerR regulator